MTAQHEAEFVLWGSSVSCTNNCGCINHKTQENPTPIADRLSDALLKNALLDFAFELWNANEAWIRNVSSCCACQRHNYRPNVLPDCSIRKNPSVGGIVLVHAHRSL